MASRASIQQITTMAVIEGFFEMLWDQKYKNSPHNKTFAALYTALAAATREAMTIMLVEAGGMNIREQRTLAKKIERMKPALFGGKVIDAMQVVALGLDRLNSILCHIRPGTPKYKAVSRVWIKLRALEHYYDRKKKYDDPSGLTAAEIFKRIMNE